MSAPAQFDQGRVQLVNGSNLVKARWEQVVVSASQFELNARLEHQISGAVSRCILHNSATSQLFYEVLTGTPQENEAINGGGTPTPDSGTATGTQSSTTLVDTTKAWGDDAYNDSWVVIRKGQSDEEWRLITDTSGGDTLTVSPAWVDDPVTAVDAYEVRSPRTFTADNFGLGTPIDWVTDAIQVGEHFGVAWEPVTYAISAVAEKQLTLAANWGGADYDGASYFVHKGFTSRGYPTIRPNEGSAASLVTLAHELIDADIVALLAAPKYEGMIVDVDVDQSITSHGSPTIIDFDNERADESNGKLTFSAGSSHIVIGAGVSVVRVHLGLALNVVQAYRVLVLVNAALPTPGYSVPVRDQNFLRGVTPRMNVSQGDLITMTIQSIESPTPFNYAIDNVDINTFMEVEILE